MASHDDAPPSALRRERPNAADLDAPLVPPPVKLRSTDLDAPPDSFSGRLRARGAAHTGELRIGIIGTGGMANAHAENFRKQAQCTLASCLDLDKARAQDFARRHGIAHVAVRIDDLIERCDAVAVVTPDAAHAEPVLRALRCDRHVLCEKPLTATLAEARAVARAGREARQRGVIGMVNFSYRCAAAMHHAAWMRGQGMIGDLRHVSAHYQQGWLATTHEPTPALLWRLRRPGGGVLSDLGCHLLDLVSAVAGEIGEVRCDLATYPKIDADGKPYARHAGKPLDADDTAVITVRFIGGGLGALHVTRWAAGRDNTIRVDLHGTRGALVFDLDHSYDQVHHHDAATRSWRTERPAPAPSMWQRFVMAIRDGRSDQPDLERGAQIQAVLEACRASAETGEWERIPAIG